MKKKNGWVYVVLCLALTVLLLPIMSMVTTSFKTSAELYGGVSFLPRNPTWNNFFYVIENTDVAAALAGYTLTRFRGRPVKLFSILLYMVQMVPAILLLMPLFMVIRRIGLYDKLPSLMIAYTAINLPICIYMMKSFFATIPYEIEESAVMDGCGQFKAFLLLVIPISAPGLTSVGIIAFIYYMNEYMHASVFIRSY